MLSFMGKLSGFTALSKEFLALRCMNYLAIRCELNMNLEFNNITNEATVSGKVDQCRAELGFENHLSDKPRTPRLSTPCPCVPDI